MERGDQIDGAMRELQNRQDALGIELDKLFEGMVNLEELKKLYAEYITKRLDALDHPSELARGMAEEVIKEEIKKLAKYVSVIDLVGYKKLSDENTVTK